MKIWSLMCASVLAVAGLLGFGVAQQGLSGVAAWAQAGNGQPRQQQIVDTFGPTSKQLRQEIAKQKKQHQKAIKQLRKLKDKLQEKGDKQSLMSVKKAIQAENKTHRRRMKFLRQALQRRKKLEEKAPDEVSDYWEAIDNLDQSYTIAPVVGGSASTAGSSYHDADDAPDRKAAKKDNVKKDQRKKKKNKQDKKRKKQNKRQKSSSKNRDRQAQKNNVSLQPPVKVIRIGCQKVTDDEDETKRPKTKP